MEDNQQNPHSYRRSGFGKSSIPFALVHINKQEISKKHSVTVEIRQQMLKHTEYILTIPSEAFNDKNSYPMDNSNKLNGTDITIQFRQQGETVSLFTGQVTGVEYKRNNKYPHIVLYGKSYTIQMDNYPVNRSYLNKTLEEILNEVKKEYTGTKIDFLIAPDTKEKIPYTVSYNETAFEFIQRLARRYGEYFFWNGSQLIFGRGNQHRTELKEGRDFLEYSIKTHTQKQHLTYKNYNPETAEEQILKSSDAHNGVLQHIINPFQDKAVEISETIFPESGNTVNSFYFDGLSEEDAYQQVQKIRKHQQALQNLTTLEAKNTNPNLRLGDIAQMLASISNINLTTFEGKGIPIESYLIQEITIKYDTKGYRNRFTGIPREQMTAPYWDWNAYPQAPDQSAIVVSNNDPLKQNRVKLRFYWQKNNETTLWVRLLQGYAGQDRGMHLLPEEGDEVLVSFRGGNAEIPIVIGSLFNGKNQSNYHTEDNRIKALKTRDGEKLEFEGLKNIVLADAKGNKYHIDIEKDTLTIKALDTINLEAPYINLKAEKDINIEVGKDMNTRVSQNYSVDTGKDTTFTSSQSTYLSARNEMDIYAGKKVIGYSKGITEWGARQNMHIYGMNSSITALNKLEYKAPVMDKMIGSGNFLYGTEKKIVSAKWVDETGEKIIDTASIGDKVGIKILTRNYEEGEIVKIYIRRKSEEEVSNGQKRICFSGVVQKDGIAIAKEKKIEIVKTKELEQEEQLIEKQIEEKQNKVEEYKQWEEEQWQIYQKKQKNKGKGLFNWF